MEEPNFYFIYHLNRKRTSVLKTESLAIIVDNRWTGITASPVAMPNNSTHAFRTIKMYSN